MGSDAGDVTSRSFVFARAQRACRHHVNFKEWAPQEDRQMWFYVQMWLPTLAVALTAAICFSVASFIVGHTKPQ
jgi:hypothetical protein